MPPNCLACTVTKNDVKMITWKDVLGDVNPSGLEALFILAPGAFLTFEMYDDIATEVIKASRGFGIDAYVAVISKLGNVRGLRMNQEVF